MDAAAPEAIPTVLLPRRVSGHARVETAPALVIGPNSSKVLDLEISDGTIGRLTGATVVVAGGGADTKKLSLGDGTPWTSRWSPSTGALGFGAVVVSRNLVKGHTRSGPDTMVRVALHPEGSPRRSGCSFSSSVGLLRAAGARRLIAHIFS